MTPTGTLHDLHEPSASRSRRVSPQQRSRAQTYTNGDQHGNSYRGNSSSARLQVPTPERERPGSRPSRTVKPQRTTPRRNSRLGSKQQVSVRGRRVVSSSPTDSRLRRRIIGAALAFVAGIGGVMILSGVTTEQSFQIANANERSKQLDNELESLNRDVELAKSSGHVAAEAAKMGMVVPDQAAVLDANGKKVKEIRPGDNSKNREVIDANGEATRRGATSNPNETDRVEGLAPNNPMLAGNVAPRVQANPGANGELPYSGGRNGAPAGNQAPVAPGAPAPAPAPAPATASPEGHGPVPAPAPAPAPAPGR